MKKTFLSALLLTIVVGMQAQTERILFINGSPNRDGNTAALAKALLEGHDYETLMLTDYRINFYGQTR